ncbi:VOC family protein [Nakamurella flavida]|uniref:VOC family protein n=1 Tax=Nakamurella flavida TaxID=363630 RepID=A0A938YP13_9ACTN|nr:VOC family protein [Nakamurella flavida]MBM9478076.1 VOC family protein [Nakamurella flavida]MDP9778703.1 putative enzyme related to lactoylglutathione lyase [Nakamurella flavida]
MTDSPPTARLAMVTLDCTDAPSSARFWAALLGWTVAHSEDAYAMLTGPDGAPALGFGTLADHVPPSWPDEGGRKQFHFDLAVEDLDTAKARAVELGATVADPQPGETWRVLVDPGGHPFCLTRAENWG